jgi:hypothetical protein
MIKLGRYNYSSCLNVFRIVQLGLLVFLFSSCVVSRRMNTPVITPKNTLQLAGSFEFVALDENSLFRLVDQNQQFFMYPILQSRFGVLENMDVGLQAVYFNSISADVSYQLTTGANPSTITVGFGAISRDCIDCIYGEENANLVPSIYSEYSVGFKNFYLNPKLTYEYGRSFNNYKVERLGYAFAGGSLIPGLGVGYSTRKSKTWIPVFEISAFKFKEEWLVLPNFGLMLHIN